MRRSAAVVMVLLTALFTTAATPWPTDHGDNHRTGSYPSGTRFSHLTRAWGMGLDGAVYGSPIAMGGFVVVATENNTVYKINSATGTILWRHHLLEPAPTTSLACPGNISPSGITGSPAYDSV